MDIKILGHNQTYTQDRLNRSETGDAAGSVTRGTGSDSSQSTSSTDRVTLSDNAKLVSQATKAAGDASDIRTDKVASLKAQVEAGTYQPDSKKIAEKMLTMDSELFG